MILQAVFFVIYVASAVIFVISFVQVNGFLSETKRIDSSADLERFKELARGQMHLALVTLVSLVTFTGSGTEGTYVPPRIEDGVIRPGRVE